MIQLKTRNVTLLTDDEIALVAGGTDTRDRWTLGSGCCLDTDPGPTADTCSGECQSGDCGPSIDG